jgi:hypothetical protein
MNLNVVTFYRALLTLTEWSHEIHAQFSTDCWLLLVLVCIYEIERHIRDTLYSFCYIIIVTFTIWIDSNLKQARVAAWKFVLTKYFIACRRLKHRPFCSVVIKEMCFGIGVNRVAWTAVVLQRLKYRGGWLSINILAPDFYI